MTLPPAQADGGALQSPGIETRGTLPLPEDPALGATAAALRDAGHWAEIVDRQWRTVYSTDEQRRIYGGLTELAPVALGAHFFGDEAVRTRLGWRSGPNTPELIRGLFLAFGGLVLADTDGGRSSLRALVDPTLPPLVEGLARRDASPALTLAWQGTHVGIPVDALTTAVRIHNGSGRSQGRR